MNTMESSPIFKDPATSPEGSANSGNEIDSLKFKNSGDECGIRVRQSSREVSERITLDVLEAYYNVPLTWAAKELKVSNTMLKKLCRKYGIQRWPHRQIRSIDNDLQKQKNLLARATTPTEIAQVDEKIQLLQEKRAIVTKTASCGLNASLRSVIFMARPGEIDAEQLFSSGVIPAFQVRNMKNDRSKSTYSTSSNSPASMDFNNSPNHNQFGFKNTVGMEGISPPPISSVMGGQSFSSASNPMRPNNGNFNDFNVHQQQQQGNNMFRSHQFPSNGHHFPAHSTWPGMAQDIAYKNMRPNQVHTVNSFQHMDYAHHSDPTMLHALQQQQAVLQRAGYNPPQHLNENLRGFPNTMHSGGFTPYSMNPNSAENRQIPEERKQL